MPRLLVCCINALIFLAPIEAKNKFPFFSHKNLIKCITKRNKTAADMVIMMNSNVFGMRMV